MDFDPRTKSQLKCLCDGRNRAICEILREASGPLDLTELADRLVSRELSVVDSSTYDDERRKTSLQLRHQWLPKLDEVGLVDYDPVANRVDARQSVTSQVEWDDETTLEGLITHLQHVTQREEGDFGILEGRQSIMEYARKLSTEAENELFTIYVTTDLLEEDCVRHGKDAIERGVAIHIGSQNKAVRDLCREGLSEATVWEPQLDWLNTPSYPRVGRLILMDRRKLMLSVLEDPPSAGEAPTETALIGNGAENPLVVLVRELLGPRLDHLDHQNRGTRQPPNL